MLENKTIIICVILLLNPCLPCLAGRRAAGRCVISVFAQEEFIYDAKGKRNPFIPLVTSDGRLLNLDKEEGRTGEDLSIEGIIYDKQARSFAIVNGSVVGVGDTIGNYQVLRIEENKVIFIKEGLTREIKIEKEEK